MNRHLPSAKRAVVESHRKKIKKGFKKICRAMVV